MTPLRKLTFVASSLALAVLGVLAAGAVNTAEALTLPTGTTLTVTVPTVPPPTVTVPPVTTALPPPPVVTTVVPPVSPPPTATIVVPPPPPPPPVATMTTRVPAPTVPVVTAVPARPATPPPAPAPVAIATAPVRTPGGSTALAGAATPPGESSAETPPSGGGSSVVVGSSAGSGVPITDGLAATAAHAEAARRSSVGRIRVGRPGLVRGKEGARGRITFTFRVPRRGTVVVTVTQVAPVCRVVGTFEVRGRRGVNHARWSGRIDGRLLPPGTYRLAPRLVRSGPPAAEPLPAALRGVSVVILPQQTSPRLLEDGSALARLRSRNVCRWEVAGDQANEVVGSPFAVDLASAVRPATVVKGGGGADVSDPVTAAGDGSSAESGGVLGAVATPFGAGSGSRFAGAVLLLLLTPALVLFTLAAVPRRALRPVAALARRQDDFVLLGLGWVLVWALYIGVVYALSVVLE